MSFRRISSMAVAISVVTVSVWFLSANAEPPESARVGPNEPDGRLLSQVLPHPFAEFVKRAGSDRQLEESQRDALLAELAAPAPRSGVLLDLLQPRATLNTGGPVTLARTVGAERTAVSGRKGTTLIVAATNVAVPGGVDIASGTPLLFGVVIEQGIILNGGDTSVILQTSSGVELQLDPGWALAIGCKTECGSQCGNGYYSCCWVDNGCCKCGCQANGTTPTTHSCEGGGGPGSTGCSCGVRM